MYSNLAVEHTKKDVKNNEFPSELVNKLICGSAEHLKEIPDNSVHLMITSPPYNVSKEYDEDLSLQEYLTLLENSFKEVYRVLVDGEGMHQHCERRTKTYIALSDYISKLMIDIGFNMRGEIIWDKGASASGSTAWGSWQSASNPTLRDVHEYILIFSKEIIEEKEDKEDTITRDQFIQWTKSVWQMSTESAKKVGHPAPFPEELPYRLIQLYSFKGDVVLDPFIGSGTTAISAIKSERVFIGYDISEEYIELAKSRLEPYLFQGELNFGE